MHAAHTAADAIANAAELHTAIEQARQFGPPMVCGEINRIAFEALPDGTVTINYAPSLAEALVKLSPDDAYALYTFLAKYPHVGALLERAAADRFTRQYVRIEQEDRAIERRNAARLAELTAARLDEQTA